MHVEGLRAPIIIEVRSADLVNPETPRFTGYAARIAEAAERAAQDSPKGVLFPNSLFTAENAAEAPLRISQLVGRVRNNMSEGEIPKKKELIEGVLEYVAVTAEDLVDGKSDHAAARRIRARMIDFGVLYISRTVVSDGPAPQTTWSTRAVLDTFRGLCQDAMKEERQKRNAPREDLSAV